MEKWRFIGTCWQFRVILVGLPLAHLKKQFDILNQEKLELLRLLNQSQILQMQAQKQLTEAQEIKNKTLKWWQFWKK